ncbi:MAG TPA: FAD-linked oxidase C-terminal domain-containing protein [Pyrinomonadaceae bacterium]|nr:FAD-linked oxidase C-terminal domain-containing protein [Pyrinomonadaceae bacterium]
MDKLTEHLQAIVGRANVLSKPDELLVYECDGLPHHKYLPRAVVFPSSTEEASEVMRALSQAGVPFTPRGAGTGLSGGALALNRGVVVELARMRQILKIDEVNRLAVVQPGVVNSHVSRAVAHLGLHYVPDPSSQPTCTIGGNIAENAGGIHCLKYGTTTDHVLGLRVVLSNGEIVDFGSRGPEQPGYDLTGVFIGSEGTFGIATEATLRLVPIPPAVRTLLAEFADVNKASHAVSAIIAAGVMPAALEMMDKEIIRAVEASVFAAGLSLDIGAALLIELDGLEAGIDDEADYVKSICLAHGARSCRSARDEAERKKLWAARKGAFGAVGRISPDSMIQDAVVPRSRLPEVLGEAYRISGKYELRLANVFHAGDGNLHPLICFDSRSPEQVRRVKEAGRELMEVCVRAGGSITGEHGVGLDKRDLLSLIFSEADMDAMLRVRSAFDPSGLCNPGKTIPLLRGCGEGRAVATAETQTVNPTIASDAMISNDRSNDGPAATIPQVFARKHISSESISNQLRQIVDDNKISEEPILLAKPESVAQVCEVMKLAASEGWRVAPAGAGTWLGVGRNQEIDLVVSTGNLNRIIDHEPADLVAFAEAGVTLNDFNAGLKLSRQWLPLDPIDDGRATIGGVVATGLGGAQTFGYGLPRRHVIGMKVVLADGSLIKVGGRVVKNVAGYDLCKLFTGSYGTLGLIAEINFKLRPLPFETRTVLATGNWQDLLHVAFQVINAPLFPVAVELLSPQLAIDAGFCDDASAHLFLLRFAGSENAVAVQTQKALEILTDANQDEMRVVAEDEIVWQSLSALPLQFAERLIARASVRPSDLNQFLSRINALNHNGEAFGLEWQAGAGDGRIRIIEQSANTHGDDTIRRIDSLRKVAAEMGGSLIIENLPPSLETVPSVWGKWSSSAALMGRIKEQLDPNNRLSPGRFGFEANSR